MESVGHGPIRRERQRERDRPGVGGGAGEKHGERERHGERGEMTLKVLENVLTLESLLKTSHKFNMINTLKWLVECFLSRIGGHFK